MSDLYLGLLVLFSCPLCVFPYSHFSACHLLLSLCPISFLLYSCAIAGTTLVHVFHILYSYSERSSFSSLCETCENLSNWSTVRCNYVTGAAGSRVACQQRSAVVCLFAIVEQLTVRFTACRRSGASQGVLWLRPSPQGAPGPECRSPTSWIT